ncbi:MAG: tripartite tricarboxylate transporter substrate binding protein [Betaproteobacteria bacterium]|nr:tripartite tricarboxylate transporter substrate binding protein [Betaproteobacteria bacterium]
MRLSTFVALAAAATALINTPPAAAADAAKDFPTRPVRLIVPNGPGSAVDTLSRIVSNELSEVIGQQIVVDNRGGAAGIIGMEIAKNANPDGYTLITATTAATTIARLLVKNPTYHPVNDYDSVVQFAETLNVLVVNRSLPINSVKDMIAYARSGKTFNMASAGTGSQSHLAGAYLLQAARFKSLHVPYKGGGASSAAVASGESQWSLIPSPAAMRHVQAGRMRAIAHSLPRATPLLPGIPPISDTIPGFDYSGWMGFFVPKGTPKALSDKIRVAVVKTMGAPQVKKGMAFQATEIVIRGANEFRKVVQDSMVKNEKLLKSLGLKATN